MKPLKQKKSIEGINRARMYIKRDLDLLIGYPNLDGSWVSMPEGKESETISITRDYIQRATFTIKKLVRDFPKALPKIVLDVDKWNSRHENLLEILKTSIHNEKPYLTSLVSMNPEFGEAEKKLYNKLIRGNSSLLHIANCFSWIIFLKPETFKDALFWLDNNATYLDEIYRNLGSLEGMKIIIKLWRLSNGVGDKRIKSIILWLSDSRIFKITMEEGYQFAYQAQASFSRKRNNLMPNIPKADFGSEIVKWIDWLSMQDEQTVKSSIELFDLVCDRSFIDNWEHWWKKLSDAINDANQMPRNMSRHHQLNGKLNVIREQIKKIGKDSPPVVKAKVFIKLLKKWSKKERTSNFKQIYKALGVLPIEYHNVPLRMAFWIYWDRLIEDVSISKQKVVIYIIEEFSRYVKEQNDFSKAINMWKEVFEDSKGLGYPDRYIYTIDDDILDEIKDKKDVSLIFKLFRELYKDKNFDEFKNGEKSKLLLLINSIEKEQVLRSFFELRKYGVSDEYISRDMLEFATQISGQEPDYFGGVTKALLTNDEKYNNIIKVLSPIIRTCKTTVYETFLRDAIVGGQLRVLCGIALKSGIIEYFGEEVLEVPKAFENNKEWIFRFPKELHDELLKLALADENAETTADRILSKLFPNSNNLKKEINELVLKIESGNDPLGFLKLRLENLKKRLEQNQLGNIPKVEGKKGELPVFGEQKLENISKKLRHATMLGILNRWNEEMDTKFRACLIKSLNLKEFPKWLESNNILEIILATGELNATYQNIFHKILKSRALSSPWDFREEPNNIAFIEKLKADNINMEPWINGDYTVVKKLQTGEEIMFSIERDPVEIFSMGLHFKTCLSPGCINFFSVFSNIIDINKQVIYGKTKNGSVRARALIALTEVGGILTFNPYCNDSNMDFDSILKEFVQTLAKEMATVVLATGNVSKLIAPDWYDDGAYDLAEKFPFILDESDFRKKISEFNEETLLSNMKKVIEPARLNEITIPLFIFLPEIKECKKLRDIIYPYVLKLENLSSDAFFRYAEVLLEAEEIQMLEKLIAKIVEHALKVFNNNYYWGVQKWIYLLINISPSKAILLLKKTRPKGIRTWEDEEGERIAAGAMAYLKLNRSKQAAGLFSMAIKKDTDIETKEFCVNQLKEIMI